MKNFEKRENNLIKKPVLNKAEISSLKKANEELGLESVYRTLSVIELQLSTGGATLEIKENDIGGLSAIVRNKHNQLILETSDLKEIEDLKKAANHQTLVEEITLEDNKDEGTEDIEKE